MRSGISWIGGNIGISGNNGNNGIRHLAAVLALLLWASPALAIPCGGLTAKGCCDANTLKFCRSDGTVAAVNCAGTGTAGQVCGYDSSFSVQHYTCGSSASLSTEDPYGTFPRACPAPVGACIPDCTGKQCGDDGCGGICGTCPSGSCVSFSCQTTGALCGDASLPPISGCCDGPVYKYCSTFSGPRGYSCDETGEDGRCGVAAAGWKGCVSGTPAASLPDCPGACLRNCAGKSCGDDGCGGSCGACAVGEACNSSGACQLPSCTPACALGQTCTLQGCQWPACIGIDTRTQTLAQTGALSVYGANLGLISSSAPWNHRPDRVPGFLRGVKDVAISDMHMVAIGQDGTVGEWGRQGVVGCGASWTPRPAGVTKLFAVDSHRCNFIGLQAGGKVVTWGAGTEYGAINTAYASQITNAVDVAAGADFLVLRADGTVSMFTAPGNAADLQHFYVGQAGTPVGDMLWDSANNRLVTYVAALPGISGATAISASDHYLVVNGDGSIIEWGQGWLGFGHAPALISSNAREIAAGTGYSMALLKSGAVELWIDDPLNPRARGLVSGIPARHDIIGISAGADPSVITADGKIIGWSWQSTWAGPTQLGFVTQLATSVDSTNTLTSVASTRCQEHCTPSCNGSSCQTDGCGGLCPSCGGCDPTVATCACVPDCSGKQCGADGCGGSCGSCAVAEVCTSKGQCGCVPDCTGKQCGPNGCGGSCGSCSAPQTCQAAGSCACVPDCSGKQCGDDGCGGSCGNCAAGTACDTAGLCACVPSCAGKLCGDDGCGGSCGACASGELCTAAGSCACRPQCYGKICGADGCGGSCGACPAGESCTDGGWRCGCIPDCSGKQCGSDGCGGSCSLPACPAGDRCVAGQCVCTPICRQWPSGISGCGSDGCGGSCGTCPSGTRCNSSGAASGDGICECAPQCTGKECGPDGCGGSCGVDFLNTYRRGGCAKVHGNAWLCDAAGQCQCHPSCTGVQCGSDGCGGSCGSCRSGMACNAGACVCQPDCSGRVCGPDGCGGSCGTGCSGGDICDVQSGQCYVDPCNHPLQTNLPLAKCCQPAANGSDLVTCDPSLKKIVVQTCGANNWACGWDSAKGEYACGGGGQVDPTGTNVIDCPTGLCIPTCDGKACGPDGCGGSCGAGCSGQFIQCVGGQCINTCKPYCRGKACGDDGCGGSCGVCSSNDVCTTGACCTPQCSGKSCGSDGCGGSCGSCTTGDSCDAAGQCQQLPCGGFTRTHGCCQPDNSAVWCEPALDKFIHGDCSASGSYCGWSAADNGYRCQAKSSYPADPNGQEPYLCPQDVCLPDCYNKTCGDDGCGGSCGSCATGETCSPSQTCYVPPPPCTPNCNGRCGPDGCGGSCPACPTGKLCLDRAIWGHLNEQYTCVDPCFGESPVEGCCQSVGFVNTWSHACASDSSLLGFRTKHCGSGVGCGWSTASQKFECGGSDTPPAGKSPVCAGLCDCVKGDGTAQACGDDGCGNSCGSCGAGQTCFNGSCMACTADCSGKQCGDDGCGGSCGSCRGQATCDTNGSCQLPTSCGAITAAGSCNGNSVDYCTDFGVKSYDCGTNYHCQGGQCVGGTAGAAAHLCSSAECGTQNNAWVCQCDAACAGRGDCCSNYDPVCGASTSRGRCGDSVCIAAAGEDCLSCSADCGACADLSSVSGAIASPYGRDLRGSATPGQHADYRIIPIDDVRPSPAPWLRKGLLAYLPEVGVNGGDPDTLVVQDGARRAYLFNPRTPTDGSVRSISDGKVGEAFSFNGTSGFHDPGLCGERECGSDSAGGSCGTCPSGQSCDLFRGNCYDPNACIEDYAGSTTGNACNFGPDSAQCGSSGCGRACGGGDGSCPNGDYCSRSRAQCRDKASIDSLDLCAGYECGPTPFSNLSCGTCPAGEGCRSDGHCYDDISSAGLLRIIPSALAPAEGSSAHHRQGGATLAFWARVTPGSLSRVNPLASTRSFKEGAEVCGWTRPGDARLSLYCPGNTMVAATTAFQASVSTAPWPDGSCDSFRALQKTGRCERPDVNVDAAACEGHLGCTLDYRGSPDPCSGTPESASVAMRIVCDSNHSASTTLYVGSAAQGNKLRLRLPDGSEIVASAGIAANTWTHVALSHERRGNGLGDVALWLDGVVVARASNVRFPDAYEWDLGAGFFPDVPAVPNAVNTEAAIRAWGSNTVVDFHSSNDVAGTADIDDVFLYDHALQDRELRALQRKPADALLRVWPPVDAERSLHRGGWVGAGASLTPVEAQALLDPVRSTVQAPVPFATDEPGLHLPVGTSFDAGDIGLDLSNLGTFSLVGWLRPSTLTPGTSFAEIFEGSASQLRLESGTACSGGALTAALGGGTALTAATDCVHGLAADQWAFVAYVQDGSTQSVYVDGVLTASGTSPQTIFSGSTGETRRLHTGDGVDLSWLALYASAKTPKDLEALRSQGPAVWIEGKRALDLADFHHNASGLVSDRALLWSGDGPAVVGSGASVTVPARGRFRSVAGGAERAFSWSGQVGLPATIGSAAMAFSLFTLDQPGSRLVDATLKCAAATANGQVRCRVLVNGVGADGRFHHWSSDARIALKTALSSARAHIAIAYAQLPTAALYLEKAGLAVPVGEVGATLTIGEIGSAGAAPASSASQEAFTMPPSGSSAGATWSDLRLYARVLNVIELGALVNRGCAAASCDQQSRVCLSPAGAGAGMIDLSTCGRCAAGSTEHAGQCQAKLGFNAACATDEACQSGLCGPNALCLEPSATTVCVDHCLLLGRDCMSAGAGSSGYTCSQSCRAASSSVYALPYDPFVEQGGRCEWYPMQGPGEYCWDDYDCSSAKCVSGSRTGYKVNNQIPVNLNHGGWVTNDICFANDAEGKAGKCAVASTSSLPVRPSCAGFDDLACKDQNRQVIAQTTVVPGLGNSSVYSCGSCADGYHEQWTLMSPQACSTMWKNYYALGDNKNLNYQGKGELLQEPSLTVLRRLLLGDANPTSNPTPAMYAQLDVAGAGPVLLNWPHLSSWEKHKYRLSSGELTQHFWMSDCNKTRWNISSLGAPEYHWSAFTRPNLNYTRCVANRAPEGSACPPSGVVLDRAHAGQSCMTGFCAHDTGLCETGYGPIFEETQGASRNDANKGVSSHNDIGGLGLVQKNYSYIRVAPSSDPGVTDKRSYGMGMGLSYSINVFGLLQFDALDVNVALSTEKEKKKGTYDQSVEVFGLDVPIPLPDRPDMARNLTTTLAGCNSPVWSDGEWQKPNCVVKKDPTGQPLFSNIKSVGISIPLPIGDCQDWGKGSAAVATSGVKQKGNLCFKETTIVGVVPVTVKAQVTINALLNLGAIVDPDDVTPTFTVAPGIGVGLDVRGGAGIEEFVTAYAGVRADITIIELTFPVSWSLKADTVLDRGGHIVNGLYHVMHRRDVGMELRFLKMTLGVFVELGIGPFTHEWDWDLLGFDGVKLHWNLSSDSLVSTKVDFQWQP